MFALTSALLFADQNLLAPNLTEAARTLGFDNKQRDEYLGGVLSATFFIVGAPAALLAGSLIDMCDRRRLLWGCVVVGELPCIATLWVTRFWQLLLTRALTGVAVGGAAPVIYSLLSDLYPASERTGIATVLVLSTSGGAALGQLLAGLSDLDWRMPFVLVGLPAVLVATVMLLSTEDPKRGAAEAALQEAFKDPSFSYQGHLTWSKVRDLAHTPTNMLIILQGVPGCLPWGLIAAYLNDYLAEDAGLHKRGATLLLLLYGVGGALGVTLGGLWGQWLYNRCRRLLPLYTGAAVLLSVPSLAWLVNGDVAGARGGVLVGVVLAGGAAAAIPGATIRPIIMNVNQPESRGLALAFQATLDDLGKGLGPAIVAVLISWTNRTTAFNAAILGWVPCAILIACANFTLAADEDRMQKRVRQELELASAAASSDGPFGGPDDHVWTESDRLLRHGSM